ncbi:MAG: SH3 domain-containing protein [Microcoleaceae cyanobacterium]
MSPRPNQWTIAAVAGVTTAVVVACATIDSRNSSQSPDASPTAESTSETVEPARGQDPTAKPSPPTSGAASAPDNTVQKPAAVAPESAASPQPPAPSITTPSPTPSTPPPPSPQPPVTTSPKPPSPTPPKNPVVIRPMTEGCSISMAIVNDPEPPLNVRSSPEVVDGNIVGQLENQTFISIDQEQNGWLKINSPVAGWVSKSRTQSTCADMEKPIQFHPGGNSAVVKGQIIGGGSHRYTLEAVAGQTMIVESYQPVFPRIVAPDGQSLTSPAERSGQSSEWTGKLPMTGEYILELDSNFRGYEYEFLVEVK